MSPQRYYSVEQVAELLGLHVRTVRGYIRDERLKATRIGKQYRIAQEDLEAFTGGPAPAPTGVSAEDPAGVRRHVEASTIVRIDSIGPRAAARLSTALLAASGSRPRDGEQLRVQTVHDEERATLQVVVLGGPEVTAELLRMINALAEEPE